MYLDQPQRQQQRQNRTGDIGIRDADGFISIADRKKDMFISGGENVYPMPMPMPMKACLTSSAMPSPTISSTRMTWMPVCQGHERL